MNSFDAIMQLVYDNYGVILTGGSALVAVFSALAARRETIKQTNTQEARLRQSIDAAVFDWGKEAIMVMSKASIFAQHIPKRSDQAQFNQDQNEVLSALSAVIDLGRMYFPNVDIALKGQHKAAAFQGNRRPILDVLVWAYQEVEALTLDDKYAGSNSHQFIVKCQRLLVSELQLHLDPEWMDNTINRHKSRSNEVQKDARDRERALLVELKQRRPDLAFEGQSATAAPTEMT